MTLKAMPRHLRAVALGLTVSIAGGLGLVALAASANESPPPPPHGMPGRGPMMMPGLPFMGPMADRLFDEIGATAQQREQLRQISEAASADLKAQHESGRADQEQLMQIFTQPVVDAKAAEAVRKQMLARHDTATKRVTQAMLDSAKVLTVDQRLKMAELLKAREGRMRPHAALDAGQAQANH